MKTVLLVTPDDHGRRVTPEQWETAKADSKRWKYEIIDGVIQAFPPTDFGHDGIACWLNAKFVLFRVAHPDVVNLVSQRFSVRVPGRINLTEPEPDLGLYCLPADLDYQQTRWSDVEPFLVVEILADDTEAKDTVRNVELYLQVPGIREYWIFDPRPNWLEPTLTVYRRRGARWQRPIEVGFGDVYETPRLLPGFALTVDPRAQ